MVARPKEKCPFTISDSFTGCKYKVSLDPNQKWNTVVSKDGYVLNKGKSGKLHLSKQMFEVYFDLKEESDEDD